MVGIIREVEPLVCTSIAVIVGDVALLGSRSTDVRGCLAAILGEAIQVLVATDAGQDTTPSIGAPRHCIRQLAGLATGSAVEMVEVEAEVLVGIAVAVIVAAVAGLDVSGTWGATILAAVVQSPVEVMPALRAADHLARTRPAAHGDVREVAVDTASAAIFAIVQQVEVFVGLTITVIVSEVALLRACLADGRWRLTPVGWVEIAVSIASSTFGNSTATILADGESVRERADLAAGTAVPRI